MNNPIPNSFRPLEDENKTQLDTDIKMPARSIPTGARSLATETNLHVQIGRQGGRKPRKVKEARTVQLSMRIKPSYKERLEDLCDDADLSYADLIEKMIDFYTASKGEGD